jgi:DNA-directed RNA polymerase subunit N (RpoN/RPB10)
MISIKRCYGCGKIVWPWQDSVLTERVGRIHKGCAFQAKLNLMYDNFFKNFRDRTEQNALEELGIKEK